MPPKGKKGKDKGKKGKKDQGTDPNALTNVDRTFYELTITDLNRKLARLRTVTQEQEEKNEELQKEIEKVNEDSKDVIVYSKRTLQEKVTEITELQETLSIVEEARTDDTKMFLQKIADMEDEYKQMHETLNSEMKLLVGKLSALEEFRVQRDELMKKFEKQERDMEEQEIRHKREIYEIERKFIISKNLLMKEMEAKLAEISTRFQHATETRIAATTHRMIRENIAINNELDIMLDTQQRLTNENVKFKDSFKTQKYEIDLLETEKRKVLARFKAQKKLAQRLTEEYGRMEKQLEIYKVFEERFRDAESKLVATKIEILALEEKIRLLEQNLHVSRLENSNVKTEVGYAKGEALKYKLILTKAVLVIQQALSLQDPSVRDTMLTLAKRQDVLNDLLELLTEKPVVAKESLESVPPGKEIAYAAYEKGDLGFVPKLEPPPHSRYPVVRSVATRMGPSFIIFAEKDKAAPVTRAKPLEEVGEASEIPTIVGSSVEIGSGETMILSSEEEEEQTIVSESIMIEEEEEEEEETKPEAEKPPEEKKEPEEKKPEKKKKERFGEEEEEEEEEEQEEEQEEEEEEEEEQTIVEGGEHEAREPHGQAEHENEAANASPETG